MRNCVGSAYSREGREAGPYTTMIAGQSEARNARVIREALQAARPWFTFVGCVVVVAVLYLAKAILVPLALATLMTFLLTPVVSFLQRWMGRVPAVLAMVALTFVAVGFTGWAVARQLTGLFGELPAYRSNIEQKIRDVRGAGKGGSVGSLQKAVADIKGEIEEPRAAGTPAQPLVVRPDQATGLWGIPGMISPVLGSLGTAALIVALVVFMLLEREDLRNRLIRLFGHGSLVVTTRAFDEAGRRVSRYLLVQSLVNLMFGAGVGVGLFLFGVPYPLLWGVFAGALRFIPYVGPIVGATAPLLVALAASEGWTRPLLVLALFGGLELLMNLGVETVLYAGAAGVSQVGLLVAVAFWSWLWGPLGLLLAAPLTVCLVVMGKYVPGLDFVSTLMSDEPVLAPDVSYYQRLLAGDQAEAVDLVERHASSEPAESVYDALMLPALNYAERDRIEGRLSSEEEQAVVDTTRELLADSPGRPKDGESAGGDDGERLPVLGFAAHGDVDEVALRMLGELLEGTPLVLEVQPGTMLFSEVLEAVRSGRYRAVCIADLPPGEPTKSRYLVKRLRATAPDMPIVVGRWAPPALADDGSDALRAAGASQVDASLLASREYLLSLVPLVRESSRRDAAVREARG